MRTVGVRLEMVRLFPSGCVVFGVVLLEVTDYKRPKCHDSWYRYESKTTGSLTLLLSSSVMCVCGRGCRDHTACVSGWRRLGFVRKDCFIISLKAALLLH